MSRKQKVYEGKAKILYKGTEPNTLIQYFKDETTAFNAKKIELVSGKGVLNNLLSEHFMKGFNLVGIPNHFIKRINMREQLIKSCEIIPIEVVIRNLAAGSLSKRLGIKEGTALPHPLIEFYYKNDDLGDPIITEEHILAFDWASQLEIEEMVALSFRVNDFLSGMMSAVDIKLIDFKIEFGRHFDGNSQNLLIADEISPDCCRLWDIKSGKKLDKDVFRHDLGNLIDAYTEVADRFRLLPKNNNKYI
jgi:phosphoribosylaminoimidazole-succinocarboxamide synthase